MLRTVQPADFFQAVNGILRFHKIALEYVRQSGDCVVKYGWEFPLPDSFEMREERAVVFRPENKCHGIFRLK